MISNEEAVLTAMKNKWGDKLPKDLTADNLEFKDLAAWGNTGGADIYMGEQLVAEAQTWTKAVDVTFDHSSIVNSSRIFPSVRSDIEDGVAVSEQDGIYWCASSGTVFIIARSEEALNGYIKEVADKKLVPTHIYPDGNMAERSTAYYEMSLYERSSPFIRHPILACMLIKKLRD